MPHDALRHDRILQVLDRLLYDKDFRTAFAEEGPAGDRVALDEDILDAFVRVDVHELALVGRNIRSEVVSGGTGTGPGLKGSFPRTLDALREGRGVPVNQVAEVFIASPAFQRFRDVPFSPRGRGATLPECFHLFMAAPPELLDPSGELEPLVHYEAAAAVTRAVATGAHATFDVELRDTAFHGGVLCGFREYAEARAEWQLKPTMFLAGAGRCVIGPARRPLFDALTTLLDGRPDALTPSVRASLEARLSSWGLR
ncbi:hypothetical protein [Streptomyces sp. Root369]|uniref:hypothetical protein n=1 Tax=Streptomyces sp. Root369 TaxID=1736523 RepID=UPI00070A8691|nr:hypothetical protein [Streptomyces sp. Root369]KQW00029.1 hypothetical protein ASD08_47045 [Streptomyces sp. Root369]